jgi:hypothetical protein
MLVMDTQRIPKKTCGDGEVLSMMILWLGDRSSTEESCDDYRRRILKTTGVAEYPRLNRLGVVDEGLQQNHAVVTASLLVDDSCWFGGWSSVVGRRTQEEEAPGLCKRWVLQKLPPEQS